MCVHQHHSGPTFDFSYTQGVTNIFSNMDELNMKKTVGIILRECISCHKDIPLYGFRRELIPFLRKYNINVISIPAMFHNPDEFNNIREIIETMNENRISF